VDIRGVNLFWAVGLGSDRDGVGGSATAVPGSWKGPENIPNKSENFRLKVAESEVGTRRGSRRLFPGAPKIRGKSSHQIYGILGRLGHSSREFWA
jgi:hypothetical protein